MQIGFGAQKREQRLQVGSGKMLLAHAVWRGPRRTTGNHQTDILGRISLRKESRRGQDTGKIPWVPVEYKPGEEIRAKSGASQAKPRITSPATMLSQQCPKTDFSLQRNHFPGLLKLRLHPTELTQSVQGGAENLHLQQVPEWGWYWRTTSGEVIWWRCAWWVRKGDEIETPVRRQLYPSRWKVRS